MLPAVLNVFNNYTLVVKHLVAVFFFTALDDGHNLFIGHARSWHVA
jgi:hypothetical protein